MRTRIMFPISYVSSMEFSTSRALTILSKCLLLVYPISTYSILVSSNGSSSSWQEISHNALIFLFFLKISSKAWRNFCNIYALHVSILPCQLGHEPSGSKNGEENILSFLFPSIKCSLLMCITITQRGRLCNLVDAKGSRDGLY